MNDIDQAIQQLLGQYQTAVQAKDAQAMMRLYDPKVRVFDAWGVWSYEGAAPWQVAVEGWFASLGTDRLQASFAEVRSSGTRDLAVASATVTHAALSAQGEPLRSLQNRVTWALRTSGHVLRIVHEHTSVPVGFKDLKAILRQP